LFKAQFRGLLKNLRVGNAHQFGLAAKSRHCDYGLAHNAWIYAFTDSFNNARHFIAHDTRLRRPIGIQTLARQYVCEIQTGRLYADEHFARRRYRIGTRFHLHHSNIAIAGSYDCAHRNLNRAAC
jgi:hypothetical protein